MVMNQPSQPDLIRRVILSYLIAVVALLTLLFLPAGTFAYGEAWVYLTIILIPGFLVLVYLLKNDRSLLARRMKFEEKEPEQKLIIKLAYVPFLASFLIPGFDKRYGWSDAALEMVVIADILVLLGYGIVFLAFRENPYASRIIEVEPGQTTVKSGPYAIVRHPMYFGVLLMFIFSPLALGSYWAIIPAMLILPLIVARIRSEERILARELNEYEEYMQKTRYRLIPYIW
ncbi:MAG: methyltransferase family protein [Gammaproteobacteria bacterium]